MTAPNQLRMRCSHCEATFDITSTFVTGDQVRLELCERCPVCRFQNDPPDGEFDELKKAEPPPTGPRSLRYGAIKTEPIEPYTVKTDCLETAASSFWENYLRAFNSFALPVYAVGFTTIVQSYRSAAKIEVLGHLNDRIEDGLQNSQINASLKLKVAEWQSRYPSIERHDVIARNGTNNIDALIELDAQLWPLFESPLHNYIVATWTAFERLAEDLWTASVNCNPNELARPRTSGADENAIRIRLNDIRKLTGGSFDLRACLQIA